jgi:hypothetical protein
MLIGAWTGELGMNDGSMRYAGGADPGPRGSHLSHADVESAGNPRTHGGGGMTQAVCDVLVAKKYTRADLGAHAVQIVAVVQVPYEGRWNVVCMTEERDAYITAHERALRAVETICSEDYRLGYGGDPQEIEWWDSTDADNYRFSTMPRQSDPEYWIEPWEVVSP